MAVQANPYLVITDGTVSVTIQDGSGGATNFPLVRDGWAPAIAGLRTSALSGQTPYEDVVEQMTIEINGSTAANALANLVTLRKLLEQAERWYRGENETAVLVKFAPHGSTVSSTAAPLQAAILGGGLGSGDPGVKLAPQWDEVGRNYVIPNVLVTFTRRGLWLHTTTEAHSPSAANNGELVTFSLTARDVVGPTKLALTNYGYGKSTGKRYHGGFVLLAERVGGSASIVITAAEGATATAYTSVAPSGSTNPRDTNVLRYTPTATTEAFSGALAPSLPAGTNLVAIFANVRPSSTVTFKIKARLNSLIYNQETPLVTIPANVTQYPKWVFLGIVAKYGAVDSLYLAITADAASSNLDIDTIVVCDARATQVLGLPGPGDNEVNFIDTAGTLTIDPSLLDYPTPLAQAGTYPVPYMGDAALMTKGATLYGLLLATGGGTGVNGDEYRQANTGSDVVLQNTWTATRSTAYLVPQ